MAATAGPYRVVEYEGNRSTSYGIVGEEDLTVAVVLRAGDGPARETVEATAELLASAWAMRERLEDTEIVLSALSMGSRGKRRRPIEDLLADVRETPNSARPGAAP